VQDFRNLKVWQKSHALVLSTYTATGGFPKHELFGLTSQMRRSAYSIPTNIAEGCGRGTDPDFARFLQIAMGSACELEYQFILASDLAYLSMVTVDRLTQDLCEVKRMHTALLTKVSGRMLKADS
jgi:four helix bundle protein